MDSGLSHDEVRLIAEEAAERALEKLFLTLGVNVADPDAVIATQEDLAHLRAWRESIKTVKRKGLGAAVAFIVTGGLGWLVMALTWKNH